MVKFILMTDKILILKSLEIMFQYFKLAFECIYNARKKAQ